MVRNEELEFPFEEGDEVEVDRYTVVRSYGAPSYVNAGERGVVERALSASIEVRFGYLLLSIPVENLVHA